MSLLTLGAQHVVNPQVTSVRLIWFGLLGSNLVAFFVGFHSLHDLVPAYNLQMMFRDPLFYMMVLAAAGFALGGMYVPNMMLNRYKVSEIVAEPTKVVVQSMRSGGQRLYSEQQIKEIMSFPKFDQAVIKVIPFWMKARLVRWVLFDAIAYFGLALALHNKSILAYFCFGVPSLGLMVLSFPSDTDLFSLVLSRGLYPNKMPSSVDKKA